MSLKLIPIIKEPKILTVRVPMGIFDVNNFDAYKDIRYLVDAPINPPNPTKTIFIIFTSK